MSTFRNQIDEIKSKIKISDILSKHVKLEQRGNDKWCLCFFHKEFLFFRYTTYVFYCSKHTSDFYFSRVVLDYTKSFILLTPRARFFKGASAVQNICFLPFRLHKPQFYGDVLMVSVQLRIDDFVMFI